MILFHNFTEKNNQVILHHVTFSNEFLSNIRNFTIKYYIFYISLTFIQENFNIL